MSLGDETYRNLRIHNAIRVNNLIITGQLDIDLTKLHTQTHGIFASSVETGGFNYVLDIHETGHYVQFYSVNEDGTHNVLEELYSNDETRILFSDMHYDHLLNASDSYKFMSDRNTILLTYVYTNETKSVILTKQ